MEWKKLKIERERDVVDLVDSNGFPKEFDHVHDLDGIVCVIFAHKLNEPVPLVGLCDPVSWDVDIH